MRRALLPLALYALLALAATHPLWQSIGERVPGDIGDPVLNTYLIAWDTRALLRDPLHLFDAGIFYPLPNTLAYSENLLGLALVALPVALSSGEPLLAYNFNFLLSFVLSAFGMYLLLLHLTRSRAAAFAAGVAFAFAPYRLASLAHIQLLAVQWLPFVALSAWRVADGVRTRRWLVLFALFLWLQIASSLHGALFAALLLALLVVARLPSFVSRVKQAGVWGVIVALVLVGATLPLVLPYLAAAPELRGARTPEVARGFLAAPSDFLAAYDWNRLFGAATARWRQRDGFTEEQMLFMGVVTPLVALAAVWRRARGALWFVSVLLAALLLATSAWLVDVLPLAALMRVPARWGMLIAFALAGLCGLGLTSLQTARWGRVIGLEASADSHQSAKGSSPIAGSMRFALVVVLSALIFLEGLAAPIPLAKIGALHAQPAVYHYLAQQAGDGALIELPMYVAPDAEYPEGKRMYASVLHGRPLVNGYSGYTPARQMALAAQLKNFPDETSLAALRELRRQGVRYLVVHVGEPGIARREWVQINRARAMQAAGLRFVQSFGDDELFELSEIK